MSALKRLPKTPTTNITSQTKGAPAAESNKTTSRALDLAVSSAPIATPPASQMADDKSTHAEQYLSNSTSGTSKVNRT